MHHHYDFKAALDEQNSNYALDNYYNELMDAIEDQGNVPELAQYTEEELEDLPF